MKQKAPPLTAETLKSWLKQLPRSASITSPDVVKRFGVSRSTAARILKASVEEGVLERSGSTKNAAYSLALTKKRPRAHDLNISKSLIGLAEDRVFDDVSMRLGLQSRLSSQTFRIAQYAFSEMLNNAIDHSMSKTAEIHVVLESGTFKFKIRDHGVGIFRKIRQTFTLPDNEAAIEHLLKGKQTTAPDAHSGQGIFFTSKIADLFAIRSEQFELTIDNNKKDLRLGTIRNLKGTEVLFSVKTQTRRSLEKLFQEYANDDFEFDRSKYPIRILQQTGAVSRSQARRLTFGLEQFDRIIFDFSGVKELGQGFADELFRVFQSRHPKIVLEVRNANAAVDFMIRRARTSV
ncbi:MAG: DUF4325 domain-containing protein [Bdellovibrionales bacterium]|nr:DUF4325 domain-containing protein [Bdellovibrionales bacterium]